MTYNHVRFIRQALDGFVMQKTNFPFEVLVYDDASDDGTSDIVREYAKKYPKIIKPLIQKQNQWRQGINISMTHIWPNIRGKYVAVCDGDDYWTDENKLQIQADFLDAHPDYSLCFHRACEFWDDNSRPEKIWPKRNERITLETLLYENRIPSCSVMYRWRDPTKIWPSKIYPGDWFTHLVHAKQGKLGYIPHVMARYRRQPTGISFAGTIGKNVLNNQWGMHIANFFDAVEKQIAPNPQEYHKFVRHTFCDIACSYAEFGDIDSAIEIFKKCPDMLADIESDKHNIYKHWQHKFNRLLAGTVVMFIALIIMLFKINF